MSLPAMDLIASMTEVTVSRSPARTGRVYANFWSPWTTRL